MKKQILTVVVTAAMCVAYPAAAQEWGTMTTALLSDIFPGGGQTNPHSIQVGGAGIPFANAELDESVTPAPGGGLANRGNAHAFAGLQFGANTPAALRAEGFLTGQNSGVPHLGQFPTGAVVDASAFASDIFQYTGSTPTLLSITFTLEGMVGSTPSDSTGRTGIYATVAALADTPNYSFNPFLDTLIFEQGATLLVSDEMDILGDTAGVLATRTSTISLRLNPNDTFWVWQKLNVSAVRGTRFADAFNTLTSTFSEPENVRSLSAIPEPATLGLAVVACLALAVSRRPRI